IAVMVVVVDVKDDELGRVLLLDLAHAEIGLIDAVAADAIVADGLLQMRRQVLLPGFAVADLVAVREAVPVSVDAARSIREMGHFASAVALVMVERLRAIHAAATN